MRSEGYGTWCVCVCLSVSVKRNLTSGTFVRLEKDAIHSTGSEGQNNCVVFSETTAFERYGVKRERKSQYANKYCLPRPSFAFVQRPFSTSVTPNGWYKAKARLNAMYGTTQRRQSESLS